MKCTVCGSPLRATVTDLPFKLQETSIVIVRGIPVLQCEGCPEYLLEDGVLETVDTMLRRADRAAELEILRYAA